MDIRGVLFDKDGTLISFEATWGPAVYEIIHALAAGDGGKMQAQAQALHFSLDAKAFLPSSPLIAGSSADYGLAWGRALGRADMAQLKHEIDALSAVESMRFLTPIGKPAEVLNRLSAMQLRLGVATNDSEASARRQVGALGLERLVEFVAGYDSGHGIKPGPGMISAFARHLDVSPGEIAMVGDTLHDLDAARAAGALAVAVLSGPADRETLAPRADHVLEDISELPGFIARLRAG